MNGDHFKVGSDQCSVVISRPWLLTTETFFFLITIFKNYRRKYLSDAQLSRILKPKILLPANLRILLVAAGFKIFIFFKYLALSRYRVILFVFPFFPLSCVPFFLPLPSRQKYHPWECERSHSFPYRLSQSLVGIGKLWKTWADTVGHLTVQRS